MSDYTRAQMGDRLATIDMNRKVGGQLCPLSFGGAGNWGGGCCAPLDEELGPYLTQCGLGEAYLYTKWHLDPSSGLATKHGPKSVVGAAVLLSGTELGPRLTQCGLGRGLPSCHVAS